MSVQMYQSHSEVAAQVASLPPPPQLLLFGDSITQGASSLQSELARRYVRRLDVLNRGFGGYNTKSALTLLPSFFPAVAPSRTVPRVAAITVHFGANDSCSASEPQHCDLETFKSNIRRVLDWEGVRLHRTKVLLVTPSPVEEYRLPHDGKGRAERVAMYAQAIRDIGKKENVPVVDLWTAMMRTTGWKDDGVDAILPGSSSISPSMELGRLFYDGLHLNQEGYDIYTRELIRVLEAEIPECQIQGTNEWYPEWIRFHPPTETREEPNGF
ncbi:SGNH hydrolase-type esterase domain-containing protein [Fusarium redolens]|uniref:SGNH hydrolase-type esterase domain-containing protein n=1 Tax=Fusarium redolens TaxID=48865 RepID=A0A9P9FV94_FUSRE|nr:SGNH hydrolase-type esterase domain-containing protein [Fusarium redolens]KAH7203121.1 SGNH hydrolase-type esterase domain-containing protein [Fusarium redolens]